MATKVPNEYIDKVLASKKYCCIETLLGICFMASESLDKKTYSIKTEDFSLYSLAGKLKGKYLHATLRTIAANIKELIALGILNKNEADGEWILVNMKEMHQTGGKGFTHIFPWFFTKNFLTLPLAEKRLCLVMAMLKGSRASRFYKGEDFMINLLELGKKIWGRAFKTMDKYYARKVIKKFLNRGFIEKMEGGSVYDAAPKAVKKFCFSFKCSLFVKPKREEAENESAEIVILLNQQENSLINEVLNFYKASGKGISLTKNEFMHIIQAIAPLSWNLKYAVVKDIVSKFVSIRYYKDSKEITSLPNYLKGIIKNIINRNNNDLSLI